MVYLPIVLSALCPQCVVFSVCWAGRCGDIEGVTGGAIYDEHAAVGAIVRAESISKRTTHLSAYVCCCVNSKAYFHCNLIKSVLFYIFLFNFYYFNLNIFYKTYLYILRLLE